MRVALSAARYVVVVALSIWLSACMSVPVGQYSLDAYRNATSLKAETLDLLGKSGEPFSQHKAEVEALNVKIDAAYEFSAGLPNNKLSAQQWAILRDPQGGLYGGYIRTWEAQRTVSAFFRQRATAQVGAAFDEIICLEANKQTPTKCGAN